MARHFKQAGDFYKDRYIIALYDKEDILSFVFDNVREASKILKMPVEKLKTSLTKSLERGYNWCGYKPYLIDMFDIEDEIFLSQGEV